MSEPIPESVPTSQDPRSKRPLKRRALTPVSQQASQVDALFAQIVANVQGSSAGAGSGEFHVYKASRRREYERLKIMDEEVARESADAEFEKKRAEQRKKDEEKTERNRKKREKQKGKRGGKGKDGGIAQDAKRKVQVQKAGNGEKEDGSAGDPEDMDNEAEDANLKAADDLGVIIHDDD
ncbi:MAG: hypothetical protein OHK93_006766 [Ramalina farinacea]|uniref:PRKR-interacting protein 1 n=1 Tax=Ramalina farinacea TaxID=258253 RepID=A0AA43QM47_9LECA|nr:hypothetical protein [Ramalina farinacea]